MENQVKNGNYDVNFKYKIDVHNRLYEENSNHNDDECRSRDRLKKTKNSEFRFSFSSSTSCGYFLPKLSSGGSRTIWLPGFSVTSYTWAWLPPPSSGGFQLCRFVAVFEFFILINDYLLILIIPKTESSSYITRSFQFILWFKFKFSIFKPQKIILYLVLNNFIYR